MANQADLPAHTMCRVPSTEVGQLQRSPFWRFLTPWHHSENRSRRVQRGRRFSKVGLAIEFQQPANGMIGLLLRKECGQVDKILRSMLSISSSIYAWQEVWRRWLLSSLTFSILGLLFLQSSSLHLTTALVSLAFITVLMRFDTRQMLGKIFSLRHESELYWIAWPFMAWLLAAVLVSWFAGQSYFDIFPRNQPLRFPVALSLLALTLFVRPSARWVLLGAVVAALTAAGYGVHDRLIDGQSRVWGMIKLPVRFGNWSMLVAVLLTVFSALSTQMRVRWRIGLLVAAGLAFLASAASGTRSSLLILLPLAILLAFIQKDRFHRWLLGLGLVGALLGIGLMLNSSALQQYLRLSEAKRDWEQVVAQNYDTSIGARLVMWDAAWEMFKRRPFTGVGPTSYREELQGMLDRREIPRIPVFNHAHSDFMHALATGGLISVLAYIGLIAGPLIFFGRALRRANNDTHRRLYAAAGLSTVGSFFCFGLGNTALSGAAFDSTTYALLTCALAAQLFAPSEKINRTA